MIRALVRYAPQFGHFGAELMTNLRQLVQRVRCHGWSGDMAGLYQKEANLSKAKWRWRECVTELPDVEHPATPIQSIHNPPKHAGHSTCRHNERPKSTPEAQAGPNHSTNPGDAAQQGHRIMTEVTQ